MCFGVDVFKDRPYTARLLRGETPAELAKNEVTHGSAKEKEVEVETGYAPCTTR